jgi:DNA-binding GntR family transcriptional regulator
MRRPLPKRARSDLVDTGTFPDADSGVNVGYRTRAEAVARRLRDAISDGELKPGEPLRQEAIAAEFDVSRIPVREALRLLESEGLVVIRPHSGARVAMLDFEECIEIYKIRERLEPLAFGESIRNLTDEQLAIIARYAEALEEQTADQHAWNEGDRRLHVACYAGVPPGPLSRMIVGFWNTTQHYRRALLSTFTPDEFELANYDHRLIVDAAQTRSVERGEALLRFHLERSRYRLAANRALFDR